MCVLVVMRFTDEAGDEEVVDPSVLPVLADDLFFLLMKVAMLGWHQQDLMLLVPHNLLSKHEQ